MWTRALLKSNAKQVLSRCYWKVFAACLIAGLLGAGLSGGVSFSSNRSSDSSSDGYISRSYTVGDLPSEFWAVMGTTVAIIFLVVLALVICWTIFLSNPVKVGLCRFLMEIRVGNSPIGTLFSLFRGGTYLNTVKAMFFTDLKIFLWSLLLIIPGIIKSYEYYLVPFLMAENPNMDSRRAQELSRLITNGEKWNIFVLELSFIGWYLLAALVSTVISALFYVVSPMFGAFIMLVATSFTVSCISPYYSSTFAELYAALREKAFAMNVTNETELAGFIRY